MMYFLSENIVIKNIMNVHLLLFFQEKQITPPVLCFVIIVDSFLVLCPLCKYAQRCMMSAQAHLFTLLMFLLTV